jgi:hypothetical protein
MAVADPLDDALWFAIVTAGTRTPAVSLVRQVGWDRFLSAS